MWNPVKEAEKQAKRAVSKIVNPAVDACKRGMNQLGDQLAVKHPRHCPKRRGGSEEGTPRS